MKTIHILLILIIFMLIKCSKKNCKLENFSNSSLDLTEQNRYCVAVLKDGVLSCDKCTPIKNYIGRLPSKYRIPLQKELNERGVFDDFKSDKHHFYNATCDQLKTKNKDEFIKLCEDSGFEGLVTKKVETLSGKLDSSDFTNYFCQNLYTQVVEQSCNNSCDEDKIKQRAECYAKCEPSEQPTEECKVCNAHYASIPVAFKHNKECENDFSGQLGGVGCEDLMKIGWKCSIDGKCKQTW